MDVFELIIAPFGGLICFVIAFAQLKMSLRCNEKTLATCVGYKEISFPLNKKAYYPLFSFLYKSQSYQHLPVSRSYKLASVKNKYRVGSEYCIYLNPKNPKNFLATRLLSFSDCFLFFIAFVLWIGWGFEIYELLTAK